MPQLARQNTHQNNAHIHHNRSDIDSEYVVKKTSDCLYARVDDYPAAGYVLGRLAGKVDDFKEVELGIAPLNFGYLGALREGTEKALKSVMMVIAYPFYCIGRWLQGKRCAGFFQDHWKSFDDWEPGEALTGMIPPIGSVNGDYANKLKGMFHMVQMDREGKGQWNKIPGAQMFYAGPNQERGAAEKAAIAVADALGATLVYRNSPGIQNYGPYDEIKRNKGNWQSKTAVDIEYSPVFNLAQYGWDQFKDSPDRATNLQRPLHAIGDLAVPHHLVGTISWGHSAYEEAIRLLINQNAIDDPSSEENVATVLSDAYELWNQHCRTGDLDLKAFLVDVARKNRSLSGDWAFNDEATKKADLGKKKNRSKLDAAQMYLDSEKFSENVQRLWDNAIISTTAFLICASTKMKTNTLDPDTLCDDGFSWENLACSNESSQDLALFYSDVTIHGVSSCETCMSGHLVLDTEPIIIEIE